MKIGVLKEIKTVENRVILTPGDVGQLVEAGHEVYVENDAGTYSNFPDTDYETQGAEVLPTSEKVVENSELICKVQPPMPIEYEIFQPEHISFSFLYLTGNVDQVKALLKTKAIYFAAEMFDNHVQAQPILKSMSEVAGHLAISQAMKYLERPHGGKGILLSAIQHLPAGRITIVGAGTAGLTAARLALMFGLNVNLIGSDDKKLAEFKNPNPAAELETFQYSRGVLRELLIETDVLITAAQLRGRRAPVLVSAEDIRLMPKGGLIIDLSIDQGGCVETSRPTTPENPTFISEDLVYSCITNLPTVVPHTASILLSRAAVPFIKQIAQVGVEEAIAINPETRSGLLIYHGKLVNEQLAQAHKMDSYEILELLEINL